MAGRPKSTNYIYVNFELDLSVQFTVIGLIRSCCNVFVQYLVGGYCMPKKYSPFFASLYINVLGLRCSILFISNQLDKDAYHIQYSSVQFSIYILKRSRVHNYMTVLKIFSLLQRVGEGSHLQILAHRKARGKTRLPFLFFFKTCFEVFL